MLTNLTISNIVLIERLSLTFGAGLNILTGETGAGKSILLDALSLALGARSDTGLVRSGCDGASVTAEFDATPPAAANIMDENGIEIGDTLILRRTLAADGKSRAWVNDCPVSVKTLKQIGDSLIEIHGQFANHTLLNPTTHLATLDQFAHAHDSSHIDKLICVQNTYAEYHAAQRRLAELQDIMTRTADEREYLEHNVAELRKLNPQPGEEAELAARRTAMMNTEKNAAILQDAISALSPNGQSLESVIFNVAHTLERIKGDENPYTNQIDKLYQIADMISDVSSELTPPDTDISSIDEIEERLFAIRAAARKHRVPPDELPTILEKMSAQLDAMDNSDAEFKKLKSEMTNRANQFDIAAKNLSLSRRVAANKMREELLRELPDLKLGGADFEIAFSTHGASATGTDDILFNIKMNPGAPFAPLHKSASGGELARLMLAMRVILAEATDTHTFVFDEVDTGISGATAAAVGLRLNKLASAGQALVITHSAQVAGYADRHYKIQKNVADGKTTTTVSEITDEERVNEIARIISGAEISPESIATAKTLIK